MAMFLISAAQSLISMTQRKANLWQLGNVSHISLFHLLTVKQNLYSKRKRSGAKIAKNSRLTAAAVLHTALCSLNKKDVTNVQDDPNNL